MCIYDHILCVDSDLCKYGLRPENGDKPKPKDKPEVNAQQTKTE